MRLKFLAINKTDPKTGFKEPKMGDYERKRFLNYCNSLPEGGVQIFIEVIKKERSGKQNRYFHGVICQILMERIGYRSIDDVKNYEIKPIYLKAQFEDLPTGETILIENKYYGRVEDKELLNSMILLHKHGRDTYYPTSKLSTRGQELLNEDIRADYAAKGIDIPKPHEYE